MSALLLVSIFMFSLAGISKPCPLPAGIPSETKLSLTDIEQPFETATLSVLSFHIYPKCFAQVSKIGPKERWVLQTAEALQKQSYMTFKMWNWVLTGLVSLLGSYFVIRNIFRSLRGKQ